MTITFNHRLGLLTGLTLALAGCPGPESSDSTTDSMVSSTTGTLTSSDATTDANDTSSGASASDTEASNTETSDTETSDTETSDTEASGTETGGTCNDIDCPDGVCFEDSCLATALCVGPAPEACRTCMEAECPDLDDTQCPDGVDCIDLSYAVGGCGDAVLIAEEATLCRQEFCSEECTGAGAEAECACI